MTRSLVVAVSSPLWVAAAAALLFYISRVLRRRRIAAAAKALGTKLAPQVPTRWPFGLDALRERMQAGLYPFPVWKKWQDQCGGGDVFAVEAMDRYTVWVLDPENIGHILAKNQANYIKGERFHQIFLPMLGDGIFNSDGDMWKQHRTLARPHFDKLELGCMVPVFCKHAQHLVDEHLVPAAATGKTIDIQELFFRFTLDSVGEILFGHNLNSVTSPSPFAAAFDIVQRKMTFRGMLYPLNLPDKEFWEAMSVVDDFADKMVAHALADPHLDSRTDLLAEYIKSEKRDSSSSSSSPTHTHTQTQTQTAHTQTETAHTRATMYLRNMLKNMLIAGRDTTACLLTWTVWELSRHPDVEARVRAEIEREIPTHTDSPSHIPSSDELARLKYMKLVLNETLRLHPSVPFNIRTAAHPDTLPSGHYIPADTNMVYSAYVTHRNPKWWGADAAEFIPERPQPKQNFAFVPFHAGPRICLGQNMAYTEAKCALVQLLRRVRLHVPATHTPQESAAIVLTSANGMPVSVSLV